MIYKYISAKSIIAKLYRDLNITTELNESHILEWLGEVLQKIGAFSQYEEINDILELTDGKAFLPSNFDRLVYITHNNKPLSWSTSSNLHNYDCPDCNKIPNCCTDNNFYISNNIIITDIKEKDSKICITYLGVPIDEEGYPLIPDDIYFIEACSKYVMYMLDYREWRKGNIPDKVVQKSEQDYLFYINSARGSANMPNLAQLERLKNVWVRLSPLNNEYSKNFRNLGNQERRYKH